MTPSPLRLAGQAPLRPLLAALAALGIWGATTAHAAVSNRVKTPHVEAQLVSATTTVAPGATVYVALHQTIIPGWHTYWRNPGDAGQAASLAWTLPPGWTAGDIVWPTPRRELSGPIMSYVYTGDVDLPVPVSVPASAKAGETVDLSATANWLVCKDVCVPESGRLSLRLPVSDATPVEEPHGGAELAATLAAAPKPAGLLARFSAAGDAVTLAVTGAPLAGVSAADAGHAYFFPYDTTVLEQAKPERVARGAQGLTLTLPAGYAFTGGKPPATLAGVLSVGDQAFEIAAAPGAPPPGATAAGTAVESTPPPATDPRSAGDGANGSDQLVGGLVAALALAFAGGLVLNLMPCVFPVLAMKAAALTRHLESPQRARREAVAFLLGVVVSLMTLAIVLVAARAAGQAVGWGFQMQSPPFVAALVLVTLLAALNLSGVFEFGTSLQGVGSQTAARQHGWAGAFLTGVLAVVVAAPCSAPFMAGAMGWALAQPPAAALAVFLALALGLAAPFTALGLIPGLAARLPRPGGWMDVVKRALAFPMYATAAWLAWVFTLQAGVAALPFLFAAALASAFAAWCWGVAQAARRPLWPRGLSVAALAGAVGCLVFAAAPAAQPTVAGGPDDGALAGTHAAGGSVVDGARAWSPETVASLRGQGHPVFVDFTAAWCVTCQVNERTALAQPSVKAAFERTGAVYLKADWTRRDARIAKALSDQGRSGVPLYLVYDVRGGAPVVLPQLLTPGAVNAALLAAHG
jgi:thiol:disulfide interchange protein/DsbC/DsbD-like thiol-disulfide interchange protein